MKIDYIKVDDYHIYKPYDKGIQDPEKIEGCFHDVCYIKKRLFYWQIDYYDSDTEFKKHKGIRGGANQKPNTRLKLFPKGIEQIKYIY